MNDLNIISYFDKKPNISSKAMIAIGARIIGDVIIGDYSSIWFNSVIRGDVAKITIGSYTNIQDGSIIHVTRPDKDTTIGSYVTIGHMALIHAATLEDYSFVGMGSIIIDGAYMEKFSMLAAGGLLTGGKRIKTGELWAGNPAKFVRNLTELEMENIKKSAENYAKHVDEYNQILYK